MQDRIPTGIEGLDLILTGGFLRGQAVLLEGAPGTGKTTLGVQFIHAGAARHDEAGLIITFEQLPAQLYREAAQFGWDLPALEAADKLRVVCTSPQVLRDQLHGSDSVVDDWIRQTGARRLLIDSLSHLAALDRDPNEQRLLVVGLLNALKQRGLTVVATREVGPQGEASLPFAGYVADTVIQVGRVAGRRYLEVLKTRGQEHVAGRHPFRFGPEGIAVFPPPQVPDAPAPDAEAPLVSTGVAGLDHLLDGGLRRGASLLLGGESGTGKTILGVQFLLEGIQRGEPGLLCLSHETPASVERTTASFGWDLARPRAEGKLDVLEAPFATTCLAEHLWRIQEHLRRGGIRRVVFDSLSAMLHEVSHAPHLLRERVDQLVRLTRGQGATALFISELPGGSGQSSAYGVAEPLADAVVLLRSRREGTRRRRGIEVLKARGVNHVLGERRMRITPAGIQVFYRPTAGAEQEDA